MSTQKTWLQLKDDGSEHFKKRRWLEAMNCYTLAIRLKSDEAVLYSNRAICEIQLKKMQLAREDAQTAISFDSRNIKYFRVLSEALMGLKLFDEALIACERGLKLDPREPTLLLRQRECKIKSSDRKEQMKKLESKKPRIESYIPKPDDVEVKEGGDFDEFLNLTLGYVHLDASNFDEKKALEFFERAAQNGNPRALYQLGLMHYEGKAELAEDPFSAVKLWKRAAAHKPFFEKNGEIFPNEGVASSENAIGNAFRDGKGVEQNDAEAFKWYERASEHGCPESWKNLASFLEKGKGCQRDAASAKMWLTKFAEFEDDEDDWEDQDDSDEDEDDSCGNSDLEDEYTDDEVFEMQCVLEVFAPGSFRNPVTVDLSELLPVMMERRLEGWPSAKLFFEAIDKWAEAHHLLVEKKFNESFVKIREKMNIWPLSIFNPTPFIAAARKVLTREPNNHAAMYVIATCLPGIDANEKYRLAKRCVELGPSVPDYCFLLAMCLVDRNKKKRALEYLEKAISIKLRPVWLFTRAVYLRRLMPSRTDLAKEALQKFLSSVPSDYDRVPQAYFLLAFVFSENDQNDMAAALYRKGQIADHSSIRLPCLQNMEAEVTRVLLKKCLEDRGLWPVGSEISDRVKMCDTCTKVESLSACTNCKKVWYCSEQCREHNWIIHKRFCTY